MIKSLLLSISQAAIGPISDIIKEMIDLFELFFNGLFEVMTD